MRCEAIPEDIYFCSTAGAPTPSTVHVNTCGCGTIKIKPLRADETPPAVDAELAPMYRRALEWARGGTPVLHVLKDSGVHKQAMYCSPVRKHGHAEVIGVLVAFEVPPPDVKVTRRGAPGEVGRDALRRLTAASAVPAPVAEVGGR